MEVFTVDGRLRILQPLVQRMVISLEYIVLIMAVKQSAVLGCYGSMNTETKTLTSPGYPIAYTQRGLTCNWKIVEPADKRIQLVFPVTINMFQSDSLQVFKPSKHLTSLHKFKPCIYVCFLLLKIDYQPT